MKLTKTFLNAVLFTCLGILLMLFYYMLYSQLNYLNKSSDQVIHTALVKLKLEQTFSTIKDAENGQRGYLLTQDSSFLSPYFDAEHRYKENIAMLDSLINDNLGQKNNLKLLNGLVEQRLKALNTTLFIGSRQDYNANDVLAPRLVNGKILMDSIRAQMTVMGNLEDSILIERQIEKTHRTNIAPLWAFVFFAFAVMILLVSFYRIRNDLAKQSKLSKQLTETNRDLANQKAFAELLVESSPDMILAYDKKLNIIVWNKKSEEHTGFSREQVLGKNTLDFFPEYNNDTWKNAMNEVLNGKSLHYPKVKFQQRVGYGESFVIPLRTPDREIFGLLSITRDISELVKASNDSEMKNEELERTNQELASFSYVASHDLQEPLRKIQGFTGRILEKEGGSFSDTTKDYFNRIVSAASRMQGLIDALLDFSRTNTTEIIFQEINLNQLLEEVKTNLKENIEEKNAVIESSTLPTIPVVQVQFQQLLSNLLSNALKYSKPSVLPHIKLNASIISGEEIKALGGDVLKKYHRISVEDNGIGFEQKYANKIFELFQRLHGKTEYTGTGIGLAICKKIVQNHGGIMTATGKPGEGARFDIYLPVA
ncbi:MAG: CHASE3 domain-containing protein [Bacteroidota bacterium]